ncbi:ABC transporter ATP-binding protein [Sandarakinorhabdus limnophila]|uniref:ABC transporter ATP-binding protein n=1 Tax=Sandarakinorhabdus limnophila TaxID=210512 RepID=UPI001FB0633A|nr:ABC transporter ATP-binding protein [Sandarakinorhabdus limnophila]
MATSVLAATGLARAVPLAGGGRRSLFSGVNIALAPGEVVAITGESGVGKSTLLNVIAGLDAPDAGEVLIGGKNVAALAEPDRARLRALALGFVFQAFHVLPHLSLARNVALPCLLAGMNAADALARAEATLAEVGLAGRGGDWPAVLSGGELQRVAIARALVHRPGLVLADEPTGNLDPETAGRILDLLLAQARDRQAAVLIVTHSEMVAAAADRVLRLSASGLVPA